MKKNIIFINVILYMKIKFIMIFVLLFLCLFLFTGIGYSIDNSKRSVWIWKDAYDMVVSSNWNSLFSFCFAPHANTNVSVDNLYFSAENGSSVILGLGNSSYSNNLRNFIQDAHNREFTVHYLTGDKSWAYEHLQDGKDRCDIILDYNKSVKPSERFDGIHYDVEPYLRSDFDEDAWNRMLELFNYCQSQIDSFNSAYNDDITFSVDIPFWYDSTEPDYQYTFTSPSEIIDIVDYITVMGYRDSASNTGHGGIIDICSGEIQDGADAEKYVEIGVETQPDQDPQYISFWEEKNSYMESQLALVYNTYKDEEYYKGLSIHHFGSYTNLVFGEGNTYWAPVPFLISPEGKEVWNKIKTIKWKCWDTNDDINHFDLYYKKSNENNYVYLDGSFSADSTNYNFDTTQLENGKYYIRIVAIDNQGLIGWDRCSDYITILNLDNIIDDYEGTEVIRYTTNNNTILGAQIQSTIKTEGTNALKVDYYGGGAGVFTGRFTTKKFITNYNMIRFWIRGDGSGCKLRIAIIETNGTNGNETWVTPAISVTNNGYWLECQYNFYYFERLGSTGGNGNTNIDHAIIGYSLVYTNNVASTHYIDNIKLDYEYFVEPEEPPTNIIYSTNLSTNIYYVKTMGNNNFAGTNWATAWQTISYAASNTNVGPGDTVIVSNGTYNEQVSFRVSGWNSHYVTFKSYVTNSAIIFGGFTRNYGFWLHNIKYLRIEGFKIENNKNSGIYITGISRCNIITNNYILKNGDNAVSGFGIYLKGQYVDYNKILNNELKGQTSGTIYQYEGIVLNDGDYNVISSNLVSHHRNNGIHLLGAACNNIIQNAKIDNVSFEGIKIEGQSKYNILSGIETTSIWDYSIYLVDKAQYNTITNCNIKSYQDYGIYFNGTEVSHNYIIDNNIHGNITWNGRNGIYILNGNYNEINNNEICSNNDNGLFINNGDNNIIGESNRIYNNNYGVWLEGSAENNSITSNIIYKNTVSGINFEGNNIKNNKIVNNYIYGPSQQIGIRVNHSDNNIISGSNRIYKNTVSGIVLTGNATENKIKENNIYSNYSVGVYFDTFSKDNELIDSKIYGLSQIIGVKIVSTSGGNNIRDNYIWEQTIGVVCSNGWQRNSIKYNYIYNNSRCGIYFNNGARSNIIYNNDIWSNVIYGIYFNNAHGNSIKLNKVSGVGQNIGICLSNNSYDNKIELNKIDGHPIYGIFLDSSDNNRIIKNSIWSNKGGIYLNSAGYNNINNLNEIYDNHDYGIYLDGNCSQNSIGGNKIYRNYNIYGNAGILICGNGGSAYGNNLYRNNIFNNSAGIIITNSGGNFICNNNCYSNINGLIIKESPNIDVSATNLFHNNIKNGINVLGNNSSGASINDNNIIYYNQIGIYITNANNVSITKGSNTANIITNNKYGIYITGTAISNTITMGNINGNTNGLYIAGQASYAYIGYVESLNNNVSNGIYINSSEISNVQIRYCTNISGNDTGIRVSKAKNNFIYRCNVNNNNNGIILENSAENNTVQELTVQNNNKGIYITSNAYSNLIFRCESIRGLNYGIDNNNIGIQFDNGDYNYIIKNRIYDNTGDGVNLSNDSDNNKFQKNRIFGNTGDGIDINVTSDNTLIINNTFYKNTGDGINNANNMTGIINIITKDNAKGIDSSANVSVSNSCINDGFSIATITTNNCTTNNPLFVDEANNDFHLNWNSPCIGTAKPNPIPACMGAHTLYIKLDNTIAGSNSIVRVYFTTALKVGSISNKGYINIWSNPLGSFNYSTIAETGIKATSSWGGSIGGFERYLHSDPKEQYVDVYRLGNGNNSIQGQTENIIISNWVNAGVGTNMYISINIKSDYETFHHPYRDYNFPYRTQDFDDEGLIEFEEGNRFGIFGYTNRYVCWAIGSNTLNNGWGQTRSKPWKTIQYAAKQLIPGQSVIVLSGIQYESVKITNAGSNPYGLSIQYIAEDNAIVTPRSNNFVYGYNGFHITASNIRITGFNITGASNAGIYITNADNVIITSNKIYGNTNYGCNVVNSDGFIMRFCNVYKNKKGLYQINTIHNGFIRMNEIYSNDIGILFDSNIRRVNMYDNDIYYNSNGGIYLKGGTIVSNYIAYNDMYNNLFGIKITNGIYNRFEYNTIAGCFDSGIIIIGKSTNNRLMGNTSMSNSGYGIIISGISIYSNIIKNNNLINNKTGLNIIGSKGNVISANNNIGDNTNYGIYITEGAYPNYILDNNIYNNRFGGIYITNGSGTNNIIRSNYIINSSQGVGIFIENSFSNYIITNIISGNHKSGIYLQGAVGNANKIISNTIINNFDNGISCENIFGFYNVIRHNTIISNNGYGIYFRVKHGCNNLINNNDINYSFNNYGVSIVGTNSGSLITNNIIVDNTMIGNRGGIQIEGSNVLNTAIERNYILGKGINDGIHIKGEGLYYIRDNTAINSNMYGIRLITKAILKMTITNNNIKYNNSSGIYFESDSVNSNRFVDNNIISNVSYGIFFSNTEACNNYFNKNVIADTINNSGVYMGATSSLNAVRNNVFTNNQIFGNNYAGIYFYGDYVEINNIKDNNIYNNQYYGIYIIYGDYNTISDNNNIYNNQYYGIYIIYGNYNTISDNNNIYNQNNGICISYGDYNTISDNNNIYNNQYYGIYIDNGAHNIISDNNNIYNNQNSGIYIIGNYNIISDNNNIYNNQNSGIYIIYGNYNTISDNNNIYNNQYYGIYINNGAQYNKITNNQIYSNRLNGIFVSGSTANNNTIKANNIHNHQSYGIYINNGDYNTISDNNNIHNNDVSGIYLRNGAQYNKITNNQIYSNDSEGIYLLSSHNTVKTNNIYGPNQNYGIRINNGDYNTISDNNNIHNNDNEGIYLHGDANYNIIINNQIYSNVVDGIILQGNSTSHNTVKTNNIYDNNQNNGICISYGDYNTISDNNNIHNNDDSGIYLRNGANYNTITNNQIYSNNCGIWIYTDYNNIKDNYIYENTNVSGIYIINGDYNIITKSNNINNNKSGIYFAGTASYNEIKNNLIFSNQGSGVIFNTGSGHNNVSVNNRIYFNDGFGVYITNVAFHNFFTNNQMFSNFNNTCEMYINSSTVYSNFIGYHIFYDKNNTNQIIINNGYGNQLHGNIFKSSIKFGILLKGNAYNNIISSNTFCSNQDTGIFLENNADNTRIVYNKIVYNNRGIRINNSTSCSLYRNAVFANKKEGILLDNGDQTKLINNSIVSNGADGNESGVKIYNISDNNEIKNNIIGLNKGYGINLLSGSITLLTYNNVFSNSLGNYASGITPGIGTITNVPLWLSFSPNSSNFLYLSNASPCIDAGDPVDIVPSGGGPRIDMGWKEFARDMVKVNLSKNIASVTLNNNGYVNAIPGATINYLIECDIISYGNCAATNIVVYDKLNNNVTYYTGFLSPDTGYIIEFATNDIVDQSYDSSDYKTSVSDKNEIKWVRWKKKNQTTSNNYIYYKVIIK